MRLEWLEDILAVAASSSLSEAAEARHLTQSAFSRRLRMIEAHIGAELFDRSRKPVRLHSVILERRDKMEQMANSLRQLTADLRGDSVASEGKVRIVSQHALTAVMTPSLVEGLQARNNRIVLHLRSENMQECFTLLLARRADIAIVYRMAGSDLPLYGTAVDVLSLGGDRLIPVIAPQKSSIDDAAGTLTYIAYPAEVFLGQVMDREILPSLGPGLQAVAMAETALTLAAVEMALAGYAVAWVPHSLASKYLRERRLDDLSSKLPSCELQVTAVRLSQERRPAVQEVWHWISQDAMSEANFQEAISRQGTTGGQPTRT